MGAQGRTTFVADSKYAINMATGRTVPNSGKGSTNRLLAVRLRIAYGSGWTLQVKWKGYDEITPEPLGRVLRDTAGHEGILSEIDQCKNDYYLKNPKKAPRSDESFEAPEPTRIRSPRGRGKLPLTSSSPTKSRSPRPDP